MSLFGTSPEADQLKPTAQSKPIFGDDGTTASQSTISLFAEDDTSETLWSMPTPKRNARQNLVKNLLPNTNVPDFYIDSFDAVLHSEGRGGSGISLTAVRGILSSSGLSSSEQQAILNLIVPGGQESAGGIGRSEYNVLLALVGLGQEGDDITLDGVDERKRSLPLPRVEYLENIKSANAQAQTKPPPTEDMLASSPQTIRPDRKPRQESFGADLNADPWASPSRPAVPPPSTAAHTMRTSTLTDEFSNMAVNGTTRTTSTFTTRGDQQESTSSTMRETSGSGAGNGWNSYNGSNSGGFTEQPTLRGGFGDDDGQTNRPGPTQQPSTTGSIVIPPGTGEMVIINMLPDKEGMFLFQHHNYEVKTIRRGSSVVRRYSDFVWLLDCLQKRYPFRRLPLLPPKRVQVNGNHLAADTGTFLEKRRRGLVRFSNLLVQHPILSQETLVVMFLTVPTELSVWRKQATFSVQEEFTGKPLPPNLEDSLPTNLPDLFEQVRAGVKRSAEVYISLCTLLERLARRNEGLAADSLRFSLALQTLTEGTTDMYAIDNNDVPLLDEGIRATAKHLSNSQTLLEDEARAWDTGVLEDLKKIRDAMVSMRDLFDRRDKYARNNIPQLEKRIEASEGKLQQLRQKPPGAVKPGELEKVESSIMSDKESIVAQHARGVFIKECVRDEIVTFQRTIYVTSRLHQDWSQERVKYAELQASNWKALTDQLESMPVGES